MITKTELSALLHGIEGLNVGEGEGFLDQKGRFPRCAYFEIAWEDDTASGDAYDETVTYQISLRPAGPGIRLFWRSKRRLTKRACIRPSTMSGWRPRTLRPTGTAT